jgi:hypothetical protein
MEKSNNEGVFTLDDLDAADAATMEVMAFGRPTGWTWTFAGPGHPKTIAQSDRYAREALVTEKLQAQAQVNGKKWKAPEESLDERRAKNINHIVERLIGWSPFKVSRDGPEFPFTEENARTVLADRRKVDIYTQALDFLREDLAFTKRSATASAPSPSEASASTSQ